MIKKILLSFALFFCAALPVSASLWSYYTERGLALPSVASRSTDATACGIENYTGTYDQNIALEACLRGQNLGLVGNPLPTDNYDTYLTSPLAATGATVYVNALPTGITESIYTIFASDGTTVSEKIYCSGATVSPNKLTGCVRGVSASPGTGGVISETAGTGSAHSKNSRIAITDNINFSGKALSILFGNQMTSSTELIFGRALNESLKMYYHKGSATSSDPYVFWNGTNMGWSDNAVDTYTFAAGGSGLTASTTKGITITGSKILVNASSTGGLEFDTSGSLQVNTSSTTGIEVDSSGVKLNPTTVAALLTSVQPTGAVSAYASSTAPTGWLNCDGSAISRTTYSLLYAVVGTTYGSGDGSTTFNIPNLKGRQPLGFGSATTTFDVMGETGGEDTHLLSTNEMPAHTHELQKSTGTAGTTYQGDGSTGYSGTWNTGSTGGGTTHNILDPFIVLNYIIKY